MTANLLIAAGFAFMGIVIGAYVLDQYHERQRAVLLAIADAAEAERDIVRAELARCESLVDALGREIAILKAQRSQAEPLHAERIRNLIAGTIVVWTS